MVNKTILSFLDELSSSSPTPGGGSVAALIGAVSASLCNMVYSLTIGKKAYKELSDEDRNLVDESFDKCKKSVNVFLQFAEKDIEAFSNLMNSYKLPKETEEEIKTRKEAINKYSDEALEVPKDLLKSCLPIYDFIETAITKGNKNLKSDAEIAAIMLHATIESCIINIKVNTHHLDNESKENITNLCKEALNSSILRKDELVDLIISK